MFGMSILLFTGKKSLDITQPRRIKIRLHRLSVRICSTLWIKVMNLITIVIFVGYEQYFKNECVQIHELSGLLLLWFVVAALVT